MAMTVPFMEASQYRVSGFVLPQPGLLAKTISMAWAFILQEIHITENLLDIQRAKYLWRQFTCSNKIMSLLRQMSSLISCNC